MEYMLLSLREDMDNVCSGVGMVICQDHFNTPQVSVDAKRATDVSIRHHMYGVPDQRNCEEKCIVNASRWGGKHLWY